VANGCVPIYNLIEDAAIWPKSAAQVVACTRLAPRWPTAGPVTKELYRSLVFGQLDKTKAQVGGGSMKYSFLPAARLSTGW
jgi:hypothetical protein